MPGQADVLGRNPKASRAEDPFACFHRLPSLLERREVPTLTVPTHHPQTALPCIEGEPPADREMLNNFIRTKRAVAEHAGAVHSASVAGDSPEEGNTPPAAHMFKLSDPFRIARALSVDVMAFRRRRVLTSRRGCTRRRYPGGTRLLRDARASPVRESGRTSSNPLKLGGAAGRYPIPVLALSSPAIRTTPPRRVKGQLGQRPPQAAEPGTRLLGAAVSHSIFDLARSKTSVRRPPPKPAVAVALVNTRPDLRRFRSGES